MFEQYFSIEAHGETVCSVCVFAYKRPKLLRNLITSLLEQKLPPNIFLEIIIILGVLIRWSAVLLILIMYPYSIT
jgi:hypothetical protein